MISDESIARAAEQAAILLNSSLPAPQDCTHPFTRPFLRKMNRIFHKLAHPVLYRCLKSAAVILLMITICFSSVLALSAEAREFVFGWVREKITSGFVYFFEGSASAGEITQYHLSWMPDDYEVFDHSMTETGESITYVDSRGKLNTFEYQTAQTGLGLYLLQCSDYAQQDISINGLPGTMYISPNPEESSAIVWTDTAHDILFYLSAHVSTDVLLQMAESVQVKK